MAKTFTKTLKSQKSLLATFEASKKICIDSKLDIIENKLNKDSFIITAKEPMKWLTTNWPNNINIKGEIFNDLLMVTLETTSKGASLTQDGNTNNFLSNFTDSLNAYVSNNETTQHAETPSTNTFNNQNNKHSQQVELDSSGIKTDKNAITFIGERIISNDKYKLFLVSKYHIQKNEVLNQYVCNEKLFTSVDEALACAASIEEAKIKENIANELLREKNEQDRNATAAEIAHIGKKKAEEIELLRVKNEQERKAAAAENLRLENKKAEEFEFQKQIAWKAGAPKRHKIIAAFAILIIGIAIVILNEEFFNKKHLEKSYSHYRNDVISNEWQPYIRTNKIKEWSPPYPEVELCYEDVCEASFINPKKNKVRYIVYSICSKDGHIKCPNHAEGFEVVDKDIIIDKLESDNNFLKNKKQFSESHEPSEEIEVSSSIYELNDDWKVIWRLSELTGDTHGYFFRKNSDIDEKITIICPPGNECKFLLEAKDLDRDILRNAFNGNNPDISSYSLIIKAKASK